MLPYASRQSPMTWRRPGGAAVAGMGQGCTQPVPSLVWCMDGPEPIPSCKSVTVMKTPIRGSELLPPRPDRRGAGKRLGVRPPGMPRPRRRRMTVRGWRTGTRRRRGKARWGGGHSGVTTVFHTCSYFSVSGPRSRMTSHFSMVAAGTANAGFAWRDASSLATASGMGM